MRRAWLTGTTYDILPKSIDELNRKMYGEVGTVSVTSGQSQAVTMRDSEGKLRRIHFWNPLLRGGFAALRENS